MRYYYLVESGKETAFCFCSKKQIVQFARTICGPNWFICNNKKELPAYVIKVSGGGICKDYRIKNSQFVIKDSLKDKKKEN